MGVASGKGLPASINATAPEGSCLEGCWWRLTRAKQHTGDDEAHK